MGILSETVSVGNCERYARGRAQLVRMLPMQNCSTGKRALAESCNGMSELRDIPSSPSRVKTTVGTSISGHIRLVVELATCVCVVEQSFRQPARS